MALERPVRNQPVIPDRDREPGGGGVAQRKRELSRGYAVEIRVHRPRQRSQRRAGEEQDGRPINRALAAVLLCGHRLASFARRTEARIDLDQIPATGRDYDTAELSRTSPLPVERIRTRVSPAGEFGWDWISVPAIGPAPRTQATEDRQPNEISAVAPRLLVPTQF